MDLASRIYNLLEPAIAEMGYGLVRVRIGGQKRIALQIMIERQDELPVSVDDCAEVSHLTSAILDVEDIMQGPWTLEISSPGIDRPLVKAKDFIAAIGFQAKFQFVTMMDGRKRLRGTIEAATQEIAEVRDEEGKIWQFPLSLVEEAKLILDDKLMQASLARAEALGWHGAAEGSLVEASEEDGVDATKDIHDNGELEEPSQARKAKGKPKPKG